MAIAFHCRECSKPFRVKDEYAGRQTKCPACGKPLVVPKPNGPPPDDPFVDPMWTRQAEPIAAEPSVPAPKAPDKADESKACSYCGEQILAVAKKCKHCGEILDADLRQVREAPRWNPGIAALLSLLLPGIGQMYKGQVITGVVMLVMSVVVYALNLYTGLLFHLLVVLNAALVRPGKKTSEVRQRRRIRATDIILAVVIASLIGVAAVQLGQLVNQK